MIYKPDFSNIIGGIAFDCSPTVTVLTRIKLQIAQDNLLKLLSSPKANESTRNVSLDSALRRTESGESDGSLVGFWGS